MTWREEFDAGTSALCRGDAAAAERAYRRAAKTAEGFAPGDPRAIRSLHQAARAAHARGHLEIARKTLEQAVQMGSASLPDDDVELASVRRTLGLLHWMAGRAEEAAQLFLEVLESRQRRLGVAQPNAAAGLRDLGRALAKGGHFERALPLFEQAKSLLAGAELVATMHEIGDLHAAMGQWGEALAHYQQALELEKTRSPSLEEAALLGKIGHARRSRGMVSLESMLELARSRIEVIERVLGTSPLESHEALTAPLQELASTLEAFEQWEAASIEWERLLSLQEDALGRSHPSLVRTLQQLSRLREKQGRHQDAAVTLRRAIAIEEATVGADDALMSVLLPQLARLCTSLGMPDEAESLLRRAIARAQRVPGSEHHELVLRLDELAALFEANGRYADARAIRVELVDIAQTTWGSHDPTVAAHIARLAVDCEALGDVEAAVPLLARALEMWEALVGSESPEATACRQRLHAAINRRVVARQGIPSQ
jgi:tetratricopeptide (TPR) repeat protein